MPTAAENRKPTDDRGQRDRRRPSGDQRDDLRGADAAENARDAAGDAHEHRLGEELQQHMEPARADRHAQPDFARPLGDRTSRIFMMPMPPTTARSRPRRRADSAMIWPLLSAVSAIWLRLRRSKSLRFAGSDVVASASVAVTCVDRRLHRVRRDGLHIDLIDVAGEARLDADTDWAAADRAASDGSSVAGSARRRRALSARPS